LLHRIDRALFPQMVVVPLVSKHRVLTQVAGHNMDVIKILPPLMIGEKEVDYFVQAFDETLKACRQFPGPMLELALNTAKSKSAKRADSKSRNGAHPEELAVSGWRLAVCGLRLVGPKAPLTVKRYKL